MRTATLLLVLHALAACVKEPPKEAGRFCDDDDECQEGLTCEVECQTCADWQWFCNDGCWNRCVSSTAAPLPPLWDTACGGPITCGEPVSPGNVRLCARLHDVATLTPIDGHNVGPAQITVTATTTRAGVRSFSFVEGACGRFDLELRPPADGLIDVSVSLPRSPDHILTTVTRMTVAPGALAAPLYAMRRDALAGWLEDTRAYGALSYGGLLVELFVNTAATERPPGYPYPGAPVSGVTLAGWFFDGDDAMWLDGIDLAGTATGATGAALTDRPARVAAGPPGCEWPAPAGNAPVGQVVVRANLAACHAVGD